MTKRTQRARWFVMVYRWRTKKPARCRTCKVWFDPGDSVWSPYYGGGRYHLACEAMPAMLPPSFPGEDHRCSGCGWFMKEPSSPCCSRCSKVEVVA